MDLPHLPSAFAMATTPETESLANQPSVSAKPELALIHLISAALTCRIGLPVSVAKERLAETDWKPSVFSMSWHDEKYHNIHTCLLTAIKPWHIEVHVALPSSRCRSTRDGHSSTCISTVSSSEVEETPVGSQTHKLTAPCLPLRTYSLWILHQFPL